MEFEMVKGNKKNVEKLRERVEKYLDGAYGKSKKEEDSDEEMDWLINLFYSLIIYLTSTGSRGK